VVETIDTRDAFTPGSGRFGALLCPEAKIVDPDRVQCGCGEWHVAGTRCPVCDCVYTPSPDEIAAACREIQATWTAHDEEQRKQKAGTMAAEWTVPAVGHPDGHRRGRNRRAKT
jgi:hypothetical protein